MANWTGMCRDENLDAIVRVSLALTFFRVKNCYQPNHYDSCGQTWNYRSSTHQVKE